MFGRSSPYHLFSNWFHISIHHNRFFIANEQQTRFNRLSDTILERVDTLGNKIDQLEKSINELIDEAVETPNNGATKAGVGQKKMGEHPDTADF